LNVKAYIPNICITVVEAGKMDLNLNDFYKFGRLGKRAIPEEALGYAKGSAERTEATKGW
jgi:hypothetical protein